MQKQAELKDFEEDFETLDSQYDNDTEPTSPSILETRSTNSFSASFNKKVSTYLVLYNVTFVFIKIRRCVMIANDIFFY